MLTTVFAFLLGAVCALLAVRWSTVMRGRVSELAAEVRQTQNEELDELARWRRRGGKIARGRVPFWKESA